jgi:hypothetical protein
MALLENNVRRRLSYLYFMERNLKLFCSTKITQIHATIWNHRAALLLLTSADKS